MPRLQSTAIGPLRRGLARAMTVGLSFLRRTPLAPRNTVVLQYVGPKSGRTIRLPVWAVQVGKDWVICVGASEVKTWWRTFRSELPAVIDTGRGQQQVRGKLVTDESERASLLETYYTAIPSAQRGLGAEPPVLRFRPAA